MTATFYALTMDCSDAAKLATFWSGVLGRPVDDGATEEFAAIGMADHAGRQPFWMFVKVPENKTAKNRFHPDLVTADLDAEVKRVVDLGAVAKDTFEENDARWTTLIDPEGNEFDLVAEPA
jgi:predicted enzyme related to lactoylglutathione lyase